MLDNLGSEVQLLIDTPKLFSQHVPVQNLSPESILGIGKVQAHFLQRLVKLVGSTGCQFTEVCGLLLLYCARRLRQSIAHFVSKAIHSNDFTAIDLAGHHVKADGNIGVIPPTQRNR